MTALYNEIDPYCAEWLRNLIAAGHIAPGDVDERSIEDITPEDLHGYTQFHAFAGIGIWSLALRNAGWPDDRPAWTGSCPCQPFSAAGKGDGFADERHLWPAWFHLIDVCRPDNLFGEQVSSKDGLQWLDLVWADLEGAGYAVGPFDRCSAGVGAPHIRQRLYFVATRAVGNPACRGCGEFGPALESGEVRHLDGRSDTLRLGHHHHPGLSPRECAALVGTGRGQEGRAALQSGGPPGGMADDLGSERPDGDRGQRGARLAAGRLEDSGAPAGHGDPDRVGDANGAGWGTRELAAPSVGQGRSAGAASGHGRAGPVNGPWRDSDWLLCRDGKWRPVESRTFPLAHGDPNRVGRLRAYGNAIEAENAHDFISTFLESEADGHRDPLDIVRLLG